MILLLMTKLPLTKFKVSVTFKARSKVNVAGELYMRFLHSASVPDSVQLPENLSNMAVSLAFGNTPADGPPLVNDQLLVLLHDASLPMK